MIKRNPMKVVIIAITVVVLFAFCFVLWTGYLLTGPNPCRNWKPGLTDRQKILLVLENANQSTSLVFDIKRNGADETYRDTEQQIPYESAEFILENQPDCCHIYSQKTALTDNPIPVDEAHEEDEGVVLLRYMGRYKHPSETKVHSAQVYTYQNLNKCRR